MAIPVPEQMKPRGSGASAPPRRPGSIRRTSTMDFTFPGGLSGDTVLDGRGRDLMTAPDGSATEIGRARLDLTTDVNKIIKAIRTAPDVPELAALVGDSSMSGFRKRLADAAAGAGDRTATLPSLLFLMLDDVPGAVLVSGSAHQRRYPLEEYLKLKAHIRDRVMTDICTGYQHGASSLNPDGTLIWQQTRLPAVLIDERLDDELAWHEHPETTDTSMRRARRTDVWLEGGTVHIDAFYQDSATDPVVGRVSIHEYVLSARADLASLTLDSIAPVARVLPYTECPLATLNVDAVVGVSLAELRPTVLERLAGPRGCTHLNDMMRTLADVPALVSALSAASA